MKPNYRQVLWGIISAVGLVVVNFFVIGIFSKSFSFAAEQLLSLRFYIIALALGFGSQVTVFLKIKEQAKNAALLVSGTGAVGSGSMVACCAHHITEALPFLAVGGLGAFFTYYQKELLLISIAANWLGTGYMVIKLRALYGK